MQKSRSYLEAAKVNLADNTNYKKFPTWPTLEQGFVGNEGVPTAESSTAMEVVPTAESPIKNNGVPTTEPPTALEVVPTAESPINS